MSQFIIYPGIPVAIKNNPVQKGTLTGQKRETQEGFQVEVNWNSPNPQLFRWVFVSDLRFENRSLS